MECRKSQHSKVKSLALGCDFAFQSQTTSLNSWPCLLKATRQRRKFGLQKLFFAFQSQREKSMTSNSLTFDYFDSRHSPVSGDRDMPDAGEMGDDRGDVGRRATG